MSAEISIGQLQGLPPVSEITVSPDTKLIIDGTLRVNTIQNLSGTTTLSTNTGGVIFPSNLTTSATLSVNTFTPTQFRLPYWTNSTRPSSPAPGTIGYNSEVSKAEVWSGTAWTLIQSSTASAYPSGITSGLVAHFDANRPGGYSGTTWVDHSSIMGSVNIQNRSSDWSFQTDPATNLICCYNNSNRTNGPGINIPMVNFPKGTGTLEMWLKPTSADGGCGWFVNGDGNNYTNNNNWFWWGEWDNGNCFYHRQGSGSQGCCGNDNSGCVSWSNNVMPRNQWHHLVLTWVSNGNPYQSRIYVNNNLYQTKGLSSDIGSGLLDTTGQLFNGHGRGDNMQYRGYCSIYRIYNRALSDAEISTNWNTFRSRHGR